MLRRLSLGLTGLALASALFVGCGKPTAAERGRMVFNTCIPCHGAHAGGSASLHAPSIAGLPEWYLVRELQNFQHDVRGANPDDMEGHRMRPMARTLYRPGDLEAVAKYVSSMPAMRTPLTMPMGDHMNGQARYTSVCATCHGQDGLGNQATGAPRLAGQWDWYLYMELQKFHSGMRGTHPDDTFGAQMRAMSMTLEDSTAMKNVVAYIKTLPD